MSATAGVGPVPGGPPVDETGASSTVSGYMRVWWQGVRAGELGSLPIIVGLVVIVITFTLLTGALRHITATRASIVATLEPVIATVVAWAWLEESFGTAQLVGGAVVLMGIFLAQTAR